MFAARAGRLSALAALCPTSANKGSVCSVRDKGHKSVGWAGAPAYQYVRRDIGIFTTIKVYIYETGRGYLGQVLWS
jgi:hypothetical protein